ncbi:hypothetical protein QUA69_22280 [Microcoleus sp. LAD1_D1]|uniref:hypothetical protein n=1 Tax=Microcoleus sp. LAD1_D1 TaxID=2818812 RepID=UPI002FD5C85F
MESDQLPEGYYNCSGCGRETPHEYLQNIPATFYETCDGEELERLEEETPFLLTCMVGPFEPLNIDR